MAQELSFDQVLEQLRRRDDEAAAQVFDRFARRLIALARDHLDQRLRKKLDPEDVIQSVFETVFRRLADGQFDLGDWDGLWGLLTRVTLRKCGKWSEHFHTQARDVVLEVSPPGLDDSAGGWGLIGREPTPAEALTLADTVRQVTDGLDERERRIVHLSLQGYSASEVGEQAGCTLSKVYRVLRLVRARLERLRDEE